MRSDGTKKSPVRMLVYLLLLAAVVALGYFTDIVDFTELKAVFSLKLTALLKLAVMVLLVLLVSNLVIFILHGIKPRTHRGGSVLSLLSSLVKYVAGIIIVCQSLSLLGVNVGTIIASVTADTTAKTSSCQPKLTVNRLTTMAAAAPTANQTETRAVVAASTAIKAMMAASQSIVSNHIKNAPFCRIIL